MSDAADFALPLSKHPRYRQAEARIFDSEFPLQSITESYVFPFASRCWTAGARYLAGGLASGAAGLVLLSEISKTPTLAIQMAIVGTVLSIVAVGCFVQAMHEFFGRLIIDCHGIRCVPLLTGFSISWEELRSWDVRDDVPDEWTIPTVRFWVPDQPVSYSIANTRLSESDRHQIRRLLQLRVPQLELAPTVTA